jgi:hypothetical protein
VHLAEQDLESVSLMKSHLCHTMEPEKLAVVAEDVCKY